MELEEAKKQCELMRDYLYFNDNREAIDTILKTLQRYENELDLDYADKNYISKDCIRAKIEKLYSSIEKNTNSIEIMELSKQIMVLQELLEEGENDENDKV